MKKFLLGLIPLVIFLFLFFRAPFLLRWLEWKSIDARFLIRGPIESTGKIVVVAIDEKSLLKEGRWPWNRQKFALLLDKIQQANPNRVALDIIFPEASPDDHYLIESLHRDKSTVLGYYFYLDQDELEKAEISQEKMDESFAAILPTAFPEVSGLKESLPLAIGVNTNYPAFAEAASHQGYFNAVPDPDGVIRRFPLMVHFRDKIFPSLTLEILSNKLGGFSPVPVKGPEGRLKGMSIGTSFVPTNSKSELWINYRGGADRFIILSATDILEGTIDPKLLKNKTVLVGATAIGIYDLRVTPVSPNLPGVLVQANLLDNLYGRDFLRETPKTQWIGLLTMLVATLFLTWVLTHTRIWLGFIITLTLLVIYWITSQWGFERGSLRPVTIPSLEIFSLYLVISTYRGLTEEREKRVLRGAFQSYLHPNLVNELLKNPKQLHLGGEHVTCTILFADVRNFTAISEKITPETVVEIMNDYFDPVVEAILDAGGYVDKFIGDAVMAIFGAPQKTAVHALQASRAAFAMQKIAKTLEPVFQKKYNIPAFRIGIGLHTGEVVVGNIGTKTRLNYTAMGDTVNIASRLEQATKTLNVPILISEATCREVEKELPVRFVDEILVKGKEEKIRVYELVQSNEI